MIKKWRNRLILYAIVFALTYMVGILLYVTIDNMNKEMAELGQPQNLTEANIVRIAATNYNDKDKFTWGYNLPNELLPSDYERATDENGVVLPDGIVWEMLTESEVKDRGGKVEVYYMIKDGKLITRAKKYVDEYYSPGDFTSSIFLWIIGGVFFIGAVYYLVRHFLMINVLLKGETSIGHFEEALHSKSGSRKYYKVRFSYIRDGEPAEEVTDAYYTIKEVENLRVYSSFEVKYKGKMVYINQKL